MTDTAYNGKPDGNKWNGVLVAIVGAILGSSGGIALVFNTPVGASIIQSTARPDPLTGTQARALTHEIEQLEAQIMFHIREHPDRVNQFDRRITVLETQYSTMISTLRRIEEKLDSIAR